jgi:hypothetical protein
LAPRPPTEPPTFFVDRCLGSSDVPNALRKAGARVEIHDDHFAQDALDTDWLPIVGANGWILLTRDKRIRRRELEMQALISAGIGAFFLSGAEMSGEDMANAFVQALPNMIHSVEKRVRPFIAYVSRFGDITMKVGGARRGGIKRDS